MPNGVKKWNGVVLEIASKWKEYFKHLKKSTKDTKLIWLQYRILHRILTTIRTVAKYDALQTNARFAIHIPRK